MRILIKKIILLLLAVFLIYPAFSQNSQKVKFVFNEKCKIYFTDGTAMSGYIIKKNDSTLTFKKLDGSMENLKISEINGCKSLIKYRFGSIGLGIGPQYGYLGFNAEYEFWDYSSIYIGVGTIWTIDLGYNAGVNIYFMDKESSFRPKLSIMYGTNNIEKKYEFFNDYTFKVGTGFTAGIGLVYNFGNSVPMCFEFSYNFPISSVGKIDKEFFQITFYTIGYKLYF